MINQSSPEILVVDDIPNAAADFAELITSKYKFEVIATDNPEEAIKIVKANPIKVVVLDQKMPSMKGTDLFKQLHQINPLLKAVMLSAEADRQEVGDAHELGYEMFLDKTKISELPDKVHELYTKFEIAFEDQQSLNKESIILTDRSGFLQRHDVKIHLLKVTELDNQFVFENNWITAREIHAGESLEFEDTIQLEQTITINKELENKLKSKLNLSEKKLNVLKININSEINQRLSLNISSKRSVITRKKVTYSLPPQPTDLSANYVVKRILEYTPVYIEFRGLLSKCCSLCGKQQPMPIIFYKQTNRIAWRQITILKTQGREIIDMGTTQYS